MTKRLLIAIFAAVFFASICVAQSSGSQSIMNWGEPVNGIQLSIFMSNNILAIGSSTTVQCRVKNSSTNNIGWWVVEPTQGFVIFLTNNAGITYRLTPEPDTNSVYIINTYSFACKVKAGGIYEHSVPINIGKKIKPGNYKLEVEQYFYELEAEKYFRIIGSRQSHKLVSNLLEVQVN